MVRVTRTSLLLTLALAWVASALAAAEREGKATPKKDPIEEVFTLPATAVFSPAQQEASRQTEGGVRTAAPRLLADRRAGFRPDGQGIGRQGLHATEGQGEEGHPGPPQARRWQRHGHSEQPAQANHDLRQRHARQDAGHQAARGAEDPAAEKGTAPQETPPKKEPKTPKAAKSRTNPKNPTETAGFEP